MHIKNKAVARLPYNSLDERFRKKNVAISIAQGSNQWPYPTEGLCFLNDP